MDLNESKAYEGKLEEHLTRLDKGTEVWNEWRGRNPNISVNLTHANLRGMDLSGANLKDVNLEGADLQGVNLKGADLQKTNLKAAELQ